MKKYDIMASFANGDSDRVHGEDDYDAAVAVAKRIRTDGTFVEKPRATWVQDAETDKVVWE